MIFKTTEKGQALVLIALAAVGLFAFAALAIDGSNVFSDRRNAQNAADTAAYAAALARVRDPQPELENWKQPGTDRAISNGYDPSDGVTEVKIYSCDEWPTSPDNPNPGERCKGVSADASTDNEYVLVRIKSIVKMYFARVIGRQEVTNWTDSVVHAAPIEIKEWFDGKALVATKKGCPVPGDNSVPFVIGGNGTTIVNNSGIFVNSTCEPAIKDNGSSNIVTTAEGMCVLGGIPGEGGLSGSVDGVSPAPDGHCDAEQVEITDFWMPDTVTPDFNLVAQYCSTAGSISESGGEYIATPGYFNKTGNQTFPNVSPSGVLKLQKGVYCLYNGISLNGNWTITSDLDGDGGHDSDSEGVFFYIPDGDVTFNGGSTITLHAMDNTAGGIDSRILHYLIYIPPSNEANVTITGNNGSSFTGMVLAPTSHITLEGSGNAFDVRSQIIGYDTTITGDGYINITYDPADNPPAVKYPTLSPTE